MKKLKSLTNGIKSQVPLESWKVMALLLVLFDVLAVNGAYFAALWIRFDFRISMIPDVYIDAWLRFAPIYAIVCLAVFAGFHLYQGMWEYISFGDFLQVLKATAITVVFHGVGIVVLFHRMPVSYYFLGAILQFVLVLGVRCMRRIVLLVRASVDRKESTLRAKRCLLIGAGAAGQMLLHDMHRVSKADERVLCIIDDDPNKQGRFVEGIKIVGGREDILSAVAKYRIEMIIFAIPSATSEQRRDILNICQETGCELKSLPTLFELADINAVQAKELRDVRVEDLLGRETVQVDMDEIFASIRGKVILVTGGGGSIGSELCRQIAAHEPKQLIIFDVYENNAYDIQQELKAKYPDLDLVVLIGSVRDSRRIYGVFARYRPDICYHAAAHKHVPLMETSPCEAIKNNAIGTYKTAYAALMYRCKRFVLVSTDKAVNPTNIMGASKRLCEMAVQCMDRMIREGRAEDLPPLYTHEGDDGWHDPIGLPLDPSSFTEFVAVRFGNVLGSNGSVLPLFKKQIEKGGPVTVTHPDITRFFMTIPEAVSLILQAGAYAHGGEIFVLDMGEPVKIDTLARSLIRLSGLRPEVDIPIEYVGLRPGEKLFEEKLMAEEGLRQTPNKLIHIGMPIEFDPEEFLVRLRQLMDAAYREDEDVRRIVAEIVPTYHPELAGEPAPATV